MGFNKVSKGKINKESDGHVHVFKSQGSDSLVCECGAIRKINAETKTK